MRLLVVVGPDKIRGTRGILRGDAVVGVATGAETEAEAGAGVAAAGMTGTGTGVWLVGGVGLPVEAGTAVAFSFPVPGGGPGRSWGEGLREGRAIGGMLIGQKFEPLGILPRTARTDGSR